MKQLIDGEAFLLLNQEDIVKILGLKLGPAIKIFDSIIVIRDNTDQSVGINARNNLKVIQLSINTNVVFI